MSAKDALSIDNIIDKALYLCDDLPKTREYKNQSRNIKELRDRLAVGRLQIAVMGQFNRGKSTFINSLLRMKILPVSVLPITSIPTIISYGKTNKCIISFSDSKKDTTVCGDTDVIINQLTKYVTEKNNPKNYLCVSQVIVKCHSQLLQHGTVIIDTPGFGSTITHNTQTTLDLLASCDATLFILSADLPITQTEVDFLKKVINTVPRIFFIYTKIDLITGKEQSVAMKFIKDTLIKSLDFNSGVQLFPVSAKKVVYSETDNKSFIKSGIARVEKEIINFLLREKYFTLSQALTNKFKDALNNIISLIEHDRDEIILPIAQKEEEIEKIKKLIEKVRFNLKSALEFSEGEMKKLYIKCDILIEEKREELKDLSKSRLKEMLLSLSGNQQEKAINLTLSFLIEEIFNRVRIYVFSELNKPLRNSLNIHIKDIKKLVEYINSQISVELNEEYTKETRTEQMQFDSTKHWKGESNFDIPLTKKTFFSRFMSNDKRYAQLLDHYSNGIFRNIDKGIENLKSIINSQISFFNDSFVHYIKQDYNKILDVITLDFDEKKKIYEKEKGKVQPEITHLENLIKGFQDVEKVII
ncbi:MAG: dynamin family protein [Chitinispirillia bacterium]|jgi:predicted GTPase